MSSHAAGAACSDWIAEHHRKIITAMYKVGRPMIYIEIAKHARLTTEQVARRMKEIEINGHIKKLGPISMHIEGRKKLTTYTLWNLTEAARQAIKDINP
jgi:DNA-binding Lrp family transcriptional regulator